MCLFVLWNILLERIWKCEVDCRLRELKEKREDITLLPNIEDSFILPFDHRKLIEDERWMASITDQAF